jgi:transposase-like protein
VICEIHHHPQEHTAMSEATTTSVRFPSCSFSDALTPILRAGAQRLLTAAIEAEIQEYVESRSHFVDENGHRQVVRNGYLPERTIQTGVGPVDVRQPRVHDRRPADQREQFSSQILPRYLRKTKSIEELIPWLYLKGVSTGAFNEALASLLGPECPGLSASTVTRLTKIWQDEHAEWSKRSLEGQQYVYIWADGIYSNVRLEDDKVCLLVIMGATKDGKKELIAVMDGYRESAQSWMELLVDLKSRGLKIAPKVAIGDGALGFWQALTKIFPKTRHQRCWVHKTANILDKLPKKIHAHAKELIHAIWMAETREDATRSFDAFLTTYQAKYPKACECLNKDRDELLVFYDFPAEHWAHIRTTNPIESTFATIRLRTKKTKGHGSRKAALAMAFKLAQSASLRWRALNGSEKLPDVIQGIAFVNGLPTEQEAA